MRENHKKEWKTHGLLGLVSRHLCWQPAETEALLRSYNFCLLWAEFFFWKHCRSLFLYCSLFGCILLHRFLDSFLSWPINPRERLPSFFDRKQAPCTYQQQIHHQGIQKIIANIEFKSSTYVFAEYIYCISYPPNF